MLAVSGATAVATNPAAAVNSTNPTASTVTGRQTWRSSRHGISSPAA
jgi:hypothetical protein